MYTTGEQQHQEQQQFSASKSSSSRLSSKFCGSRAGSSSGSENCALSDNTSDTNTTNTLVKRCTPILFSTNRGLHLRVPTTNSTFLADTAITNKARCNPAALRNCINRRMLSASSYDINFCDLERWSTNRANTVSLEETVVSHTFMIPQTLIPYHHRSSIGNNSQRQQQHNTNNSFIPVKRTSVVHFDKSFTRFDVEEEEEEDQQSQ